MTERAEVGAERVLRILLELAAEPRDVTLADLAMRLDAPKPTVHRALASLRRMRLARQVSRGRYRLGEDFLRLAFDYHERRSDRVVIELVGPILRDLSSRFGETAHFAVLDGHDVVYHAKVDPPAGAIRLTSTVGGRNPAYRTAVGKMLLADKLTSRRQLQDWLAGTRLERRTPNTLTSVGRLWEALVTAQARGFAVDDQENEAWVNCVALPLPLDPIFAAGAISVSGLSFRTPLDDLVESVPTIRGVIETHVQRW